MAEILPTAATTGWARPLVHPADEQAAANFGVQQARDYFTKLGVTPAQGNGPIGVSIDPKFDNAEYSVEDVFGPKGLRSRNAEQIKLGVNPYTGISYAHAPDMIAHEYAHRIIEYAVPGIGGQNVEEARRPFARIVDEHLADVFASAISKTWQIGSSVVPGGLRSFEDPSRQRTLDASGQMAWQPTITGLGEMTSDEVAKGPYANLGPLNNAAFRIGSAIGTDKMAQLYLDTLRTSITPSSGPSDVILGTIQSAKRLFGDGSVETSAVRDAWKGVGARATMIDSV